MPSAPPSDAASVSSGSGGSSGAGAGTSVPPSQAGRPDTAAAETDPSLDVAGKATAGDDVHQGVEAAHKIDPSDGADRPGAGRTGGGMDGSTGAHGKEGDATRSALTGETGEARQDGPLRAEGDRAESAVVKEDKRVEAPGERPDRAEVAGAGSAAADAPAALQPQPTGAGEAGRVTDDVLPGPAGDDVIVSDSAAPAPPMGGGERPAALLAAPEGPKDDLKRIRGVGPVIEAKLNALGVFHFRQIAAWSTAELIWIDNHLNFRGRAVRERWMDQARVLGTEAAPKTD